MGSGSGLCVPSWVPLASVLQWRTRVGRAWSRVTQLVLGLHPFPRPSRASDSHTLPLGRSSPTATIGLGWLMAKFLWLQ